MYKVVSTVTHDSSEESDFEDGMFQFDLNDEPNNVRTPPPYFSSDSDGSDSDGDTATRHTSGRSPSVAINGTPRKNHTTSTTDRKLGELSCSFATWQNSLGEGSI